jgi:DNA replication protein DnaC
MNQKQLLAQLHRTYLLKKKRAELFCEKQIVALRENKDYFALEIKERNLVLDISKKHFLKKDATKLEELLSQVKKQKEDLLKKCNINPSELTPTYECNLCNDTGRLKNGSYCTCFKQAYNNLKMEASNIHFDNLPNLCDYNLTVFDKKTQEEMKKIVSLCEKLFRNYSTTKINTILFSGATGVGKTYFSKILAKEGVSRGLVSYYITAFQLNNAMLKYHTTFDEQKQHLLTSILESDILIIDDLGTEPILKNVTIEYLLLILNERNVNGKKTILNTNLAPNHILDRYGERIFSRLLNKQTGLLLKIDGEDLRLKKQS